MNNGPQVLKCAISCFSGLMLLHGQSGAAAHALHGQPSRQHHASTLPLSRAGQQAAQPAGPACRWAEGRGRRAVEKELA